MVRMNHGSVLEHGTVYLMLPVRNVHVKCYDNNQYSTFNLCPQLDNYDNPSFAITTNYRVLVENDLLDDLEFLCKPTEYHEKRTTFRLTCARVQADSFVRHRVFSFLMESTRYCNYSNGKFDSEIQIVKPTKWEDYEKSLLMFVTSWESAERTYMNLISNGVKPEDARDVLPLQLKTELIMTGTESQWNEFFKLRISDHAHPDAKYIAEQIKEQL